MSSVLEVAGFVAVLVGAFLLSGVAGVLVAAGLILMVVGYMIGEP